MKLLIVQNSLISHLRFAVIRPKSENGYRRKEINERAVGRT